jgi:uncharacterized membrane protein YdbT with pleckstrin-like domain
MSRAGDKLMADVVIRPSMKFIKLGYVITILVLVAAVFVHSQYLSEHPPWLPGLTALLFLWPVKRHISRQFTKAVVEGEKLSYQYGMLSKSTRIIQLSKVQDVRVNQTVSQRMFGVGDVGIETAGETSRLTLHNVDQPQVIAHQILDGFGAKSSAIH